MPYPDSEYPSVLRGRDKRESQRLLAAAPELLAVAKTLASAADVRHNFGLRSYYIGDQCMADVRAAIAKAEGWGE